MQIIRSKGGSVLMELCHLDNASTALVHSVDIRYQESRAWRDYFGFGDFWPFDC